MHTAFPLSKSWLLLFLLLLSIPALSQRRIALGAGTGVAVYNGDLNSGLQLPTLRPGLAMQAQRYVLPQVSMRFGFYFGEVGAADSLVNSETRRARNLHFRSQLWEFSFAFQLDFRRDRKYLKGWGGNQFFTPFAYVGVGMLAYNPQAQLNGLWYDLQPLGTEGQWIAGRNYPKPYSLLQMSLLGGVGINYRFARQMGLSAEIGYRALFTDYLDDVSTVYPDFGELRENSGPVAAALSDPSAGGFQPGDIRGNSSANDSYYLLTLTLVRYLGRMRCPN